MKSTRRKRYQQQPLAHLLGQRIDLRKFTAHSHPLVPRPYSSSCLLPPLPCIIVLHVRPLDKNTRHKTPCPTIVSVTPHSWSSSKPLVDRELRHMLHYHGHSHVHVHAHWYRTKLLVDGVDCIFSMSIHRWSWRTRQRGRLLSDISKELIRCRRIKAFSWDFRSYKIRGKRAEKCTWMYVSFFFLKTWYFMEITVTWREKLSDVT